MEILNFKIIGRNKDTNRKRTIEIKATSKEKALKIANERGLSEVIEVSEIERLPTENQLRYAKDLHIKITEGLTIDDVSALIDKKVNNDIDPKAGIIDFANERELGFSKYIGEMSLYNLVFDCLEGVDRIAFFIMSIYKWVADDNQSNLNIHIHRVKFYQFATTLKVDEQFLKSMNKYSGQDLLYFGDMTQSNGVIVANGYSRNTIAYKKVADYLKNQFGVSKTKNEKISSYPVGGLLRGKNKGCLVYLLIGLVLYETGTYLLKIFN